MKILFSPIGGTDPISMDTYKDGSMLHIVRTYKPDKVILYMSNEVLQYHKDENDNRYIYCLDELCKYIGIELEYEIIERPELSDVHDFNYFYEDFQNILNGITSGMSEGDELLLNVSSGTPAMKSALIVLETILDYSCKTIQVATPIRKMNNHNHSGYDAKILWDLNEDNNDNYENRCSEIECPNLKRLKYEEIIKKHLKAYDYQAAYSVAQELTDEETEKYIDALKLAKARLMLNHAEVNEYIKTTGLEVIPVKQDEVRKYVEYALNLDIKLRKKEYADYIRAITPLILDLFIIILKDVCNIDAYKYCSKNSKGVYNWDKSKLQNDENGRKIEDSLKQQFKDFDYRFVSSVHIRCLIEDFSKDSNLIQLVDKVRSVEENVRNIAAHEIASINDDFIVKKTGYDAATIMKMIKELFKYTKINCSREVWNSYDYMNDSIIELIK